MHTPCPFCHKNNFTNLQRHVRKCEVKIRLDVCKVKKRRAQKSTKSNKSIRQKINPLEISDRLSNDTHAAQTSIVSDQLHAAPSIRLLAENTRKADDIHNETIEYSSVTHFSPDEYNNLFSDDDSPHNDANAEILISEYEDAFVNDEEEIPQSIPATVPTHQNQPVDTTEVQNNNTIDEDREFLEEFIEYIDPDAKDPFDPDSFDESQMKFIEPKEPTNTNICNHELAQIDLLRILSRSGCSLNMFDKIMNWVQHYSRKRTAGNIWTDYPIYNRKTFVNNMSKKFKTENHKPQIKEVQFDYDGRKASIPTFSFIEEVMSILNDNELMSDKNIINGYDIFTGKCGDDFWDSRSIDTTIPNKIPIPNDPNRKISDISTSYLHQASVHRFCSEPHHMPVPIFIFYDKANLDQKGGLAVAPVLFSLGFIKTAILHRSFAWRILSYVPNLDIGQGRSNTKGADEKQREHHKVLTEAFKEFQEVCTSGGFKTVVRGRIVVLKFFISYIVGDTAGHNDLCLHFQKNANMPCRDDQCPQSDLSKFGTHRSVPITMRDIVNCGGKEDSLRLLSQRYNVKNALYRLPFADRIMGVHGCTPWETLHVIDQGLLKYIVESIHDIIGEKDAGKTDKDAFTKFFKVINQSLNRQSERDFPRRSVRFSPIDGSRITAVEVRGNSVVFIICFHVLDVQLLMGRVFDKYNNKKNNAAGTGPSLNGCADALTDVLCYEKWLKDDNAVGEVIASHVRIKNALMKVKKHFPRREGTQNWDLPKMLGAYKMGVVQMCKHGNASGWDSSYGERMHKYFFTSLGKNTQRRHALFATQLAHRRFESFTIDKAVHHTEDSLMDLSNDDDLIDPREADDKEDPFLNNDEFNYHGSVDRCGGRPQESEYDEDST